MPYHVAKNSKCSPAKPWAVIKTADGSVMGCHPDESSAMDQMKAMMAEEGGVMMNSLNHPAKETRNKERRYFTATELRARTGATPGITGHAAVFNQLSEDLGGYREKVQPGAFADTIKNGDVRALWNHDPNYILARTKSGTLRLAEDNTGLGIDADLPDTTFARDLLKSIERGDVDQMSFGFMVLPSGENWRMEDRALVRTLSKVELFDVSPVTFPAYPQTDVAARAELRSFAQAKLQELTTQSAAELEARIKAREAFLFGRVSTDKSLSLEEILRKARMKAV